MRRIVVMCVSLVLGGWGAQVVAQLPGASAINEACAPARERRLPDLEARRKVLEDQIAPALVQMRALEGELKGPKPSPMAIDLAATLRARQNELVGLLYLIDCFREDSVDDPGVLRATSTDPASNVEILVPYATNRTRIGGSNAFKYYGPDNANRLEFGRIRVTIPLLHKVGQVELPTLWKLELKADPKKHFTLGAPAPVELADFQTGLEADLKGSKKRSLLLFVHGFNVKFADAALRTAQLAHDLKFPGVAMFYSWPSKGETSAYPSDEESARISERFFSELMDRLAPTGFDTMYLIAHSMGSRVVGHALQRRLEAGKKDNRVRELLLAAADFNAQLFTNDVAPKIAAMQGTRTTIYASSRDVALSASRSLHQQPRVGDTDPRVFLYKDMETVDASAVAPRRRAYGHSYVFDSPRVIHDIEALLQLGLPAAKRGLPRAGGPPPTHWAFPK